MAKPAPSTLAVYIGPHLAFRKFAEAINADSFKVGSRVQKGHLLPLKGLNFARSVLAIPAGYGVYLAETCYYYPAAARRLGKIKGKIGNVCASPLFYNILHRKLGGVESRAALEFARDVDFFVLEGRYIGEILSKLGIRKPSVVAYTYVSPERYPKLLKIHPALSSKEICCIATNDLHYKGVDLLLEAMRIVNRADPEITLNIVIGGIDEKKLQPLLTPTSRITTDAMAALSSCSLYVHPSRGDVFPVAPLEAMLAGIPAIVSSETGTREIVSRVRSGFVVPPAPQKIAEKILEYFSLSPAQRKALSAKFRKAALPFNEKEQVSRFKKEYWKMLKKIM